MDGGGLARAIGAEKAEEIARLDGQRDVLDRDGAAAIDLAEMGDFECWCHESAATIQTAIRACHLRERMIGAPHLCGGGISGGCAAGAIGRLP